MGNKYEQGRRRARKRDATNSSSPPMRGRTLRQDTMTVQSEPCNDEAPKKEERDRSDTILQHANLVRRSPRRLAWQRYTRQYCTRPLKLLAHPASLFDSPPPSSCPHLLAALGLRRNEGSCTEQRGSRQRDCHLGQRLDNHPVCSRTVPVSRPCRLAFTASLPVPLAALPSTPAP